MEGEYGRTELAALVPYPKRDANKYSRGKLIAIAGSYRYPGAAVLVARASQRTGAGYTEVITEDEAIPTIQSSQPSLVVRSSEEAKSLEPVFSTPEKPCAYVIGPGFDPEDTSLYPTIFLVMGKTNAPVLLDGGGLSMLLKDAGRSICQRRFIAGSDTVITPHAGEAKRLARVFELPTEDPARLACDLSLAYGVVTVLKGPTTYISDGEGIWASGSGTPALAKAGTGDVLAGIIGALLAQGLESVDAAVLGNTIHSNAGCLAAEKLGVISVIAEDVIDCIPPVINAIR